jgi:peroxiredoxin-like protein
VELEKNIIYDGDTMKHDFQMQLYWPGGRNNVGTLSAKNLQTNVSIPHEMDGPEVGTNPDEMLLGAAATCYMISLGALLERANIQATLAIESVGTVDVTNGVFTYEKIVHTVQIALALAESTQQEKAYKLAMKAEQTCMISKALKGNVLIEVVVQFI